MNICVIPARGGSKRIPRKNIKDFHGKPIISYSIKAALDSCLFEHVFVSTDDSEIAKIAVKYGAEVPFIRPEELSNDFSSTFSVVKHAVEKIEEESKIENVCCLYATAAFTSAEILKNAYKNFHSSDANFCLALIAYSFPIQRAIKLTKGKRIKMFDTESSEKRSQDLEDAYHDAGQFLWGRSNAFKKDLSIYSENTLPFIMPNNLVRDIDTLEDWLTAEQMYKSLEIQS